MEPNAELEQIRETNRGRLAYLSSRGVQVPLDQLYLTSLLEFALLEDLDEAKAYHERRLATVLDSAIAGVEQMQQQQQKDATRAKLLQGIRT